MSTIKTSDSLNHGKFAASPKVVGLIGRRLASDGGISSRGQDLGDTIGGVFGAVSTSVETVVNAPVAILTGGQGPQLSLPKP